MSKNIRISLLYFFAISLSNFFLHFFSFFFYVLQSSVLHYQCNFYLLCVLLFVCITSHHIQLLSSLNLLVFFFTFAVYLFFYYLTCFFSLNINCVVFIILAQRFLRLRISVSFHFMSTLRTDYLYSK